MYKLITGSRKLICAFPAAISLPVRSVWSVRSVRCFVGPVYYFYQLSCWTISVLNNVKYRFTKYN